MTMPTQLKIGGFDYTVDYVPLVNQAIPRYGEIQFNQHKILVSYEFSPQQQQCTLLHEAVHGIDQWLDIDLEEEQVEKLGKGLYQLLKDNPQLVDMLKY
jgi:hypothetical protein